MKMAAHQPDANLVIQLPDSLLAGANPAPMWRNRIAWRYVRTYLVLWAFFELLGIAWEQGFAKLASKVFTLQLARCALNDAAITLVIALIFYLRLRRSDCILLANMGIGRVRLSLAFAALTYMLAMMTWGLRI